MPRVIWYLDTAGNRIARGKLETSKRWTSSMRVGQLSVFIGEASMFVARIYEDDGLAMFDGCRAKFAKETHADRLRQRCIMRDAIAANRSHVMAADVMAAIEAEDAYFSGWAG